MPTRYVKKSDRAESQALAVLQDVCEAPDSTTEAKQQAATSILGFRSKTGPIREALANKIKQARAAQQEVARLTAELAMSQSQVSELEGKVSSLTTERNNSRNDLSRITGQLSEVLNEKTDLQLEAQKTRRQTEAADLSISKFRFSLSTLASRIKKDEEFVTRLFFEHRDKLSAELYEGLGWDRDKLDRWTAWYTKMATMDSEQLIELLHRDDCVCRQENPDLKIVARDDAAVVRALLEFRKVDVDSTITQLVTTHQEAWFTRHRTPLGEPPLEARQITYFGFRGNRSAA